MHTANKSRNSRCLLTWPLLLACLLLLAPTVEADGPFWWQLLTGSLGGATTWMQRRTHISQFLDRLAAQRANQGRYEAARRARELKQWLSFLSLHKGMLPLAGDAALKHGRIMALAAKYSSTWKRVTSSATKDGWPAALMQHQALVQKTLLKITGDIHKEFQDGAIGMLLSDVVVEINDVAIAEDLNAVLMPGSDAGITAQSKKWALQAIIDFLRASGNLYSASRGFTSEDAKQQRRHHRSSQGNNFEGEL